MVASEFSCSFDYYKSYPKLQLQTQLASISSNKGHDVGIQYSISERHDLEDSFTDSTGLTSVVVMY